MHCHETLNYIRCFTFILASSFSSLALAQAPAQQPPPGDTGQNPYPTQAQPPKELPADTSQFRSNYVLDANGPGVGLGRFADSTGAIAVAVGTDAYIVRAAPKSTVTLVSPATVSPAIRRPVMAGRVAGRPRRRPAGSRCGRWASATS